VLFGRSFGSILYTCICMSYPSQTKNFSLYIIFVVGMWQDRETADRVREPARRCIVFVRMKPQSPGEAAERCCVSIPYCAYILRVHAASIGQSRGSPLACPLVRPSSAPHMAPHRTPPRPQPQPHASAHEGPTAPPPPPQWLLLPGHVTRYRIPMHPSTPYPESPYAGMRNAGPIAIL
jgi:hypothetical protein